MQRDVAVRRIRLRFSVLSLGPALGDSDSSFAPEHVVPAQRQYLRRTECCCRAGKHEREVKRRGKGFQDRKRLRRGDDEGAVRGLAARLDKFDRILRDKLVSLADFIDAALLEVSTLSPRRKRLGGTLNTRRCYAPEAKMAILSKEVRAIQNPALGSVLIWRAASSYQKNHKTGSFMPLPLCFLVLPIIFHEETSALVSGTRTASGLRKLTEKFRSAEESKTDLLLAVGGRALAMRALTWESIRLGLTSNVISLDTEGGSLMSLSDTPLVSGVPHSIRPLLGNAEKLGTWFAGLTLYEIGLQVQVTF
jgi:Family of unknown function (DUF6521)